MSICESGIDEKIQAKKVLMDVTEQHPLIRLGQSLPWRELFELVLEDLKKTHKNTWWLGRKLKIRMHLGVYFLQQIFNKTDREIEYDVKDNAAYQIFCGREIVKNWHAPDHTKIEKFRSRMSAETQQKLANQIAVHAVKLGFADSSNLDIDSTVQEANMTYPADSVLLKNLGVISKKVANFLNEKFNDYIKDPITVNIKKIASKAREYFFLPKISTKETKDTKLMSLLDVVCEETRSVTDACLSLNENIIKKIPWNIKRSINQIKDIANQYLKDVIVRKI